MKVAISQPEHFPYLGYFYKMASCDLFIILDHVQFSGPRSFQNRNWFTNKKNEQEWFTVPVAKGAYFEKINKVKAAPDYGWRKKIIRKMSYNFPHIDFNDIYQNGSLFDINMQSIFLCREKLKITTPIVYSSDLDVDGNKAELIYKICKKVGATTYVSGMGAKSYLNDSEFSDISIEYVTPKITNFESTVAYLNNPTKVKEAQELINIKLLLP